MSEKRKPKGLYGIVKEGGGLKDVGAMFAHPTWSQTIIREASIDDLDPALRSVWDFTRIPGEQPLMCVESAYRPAGLARTSDLAAIIVTDRRLVRLDVHSIRTVTYGSGARAVALSDVLDISQTQGIFGNLVVNIATETEPIVWDFQKSGEVGLRFVETLQRAVTNAKSTEAPREPGVADKLRELQALLNQGLITEEEYQQKRQRILDQL